MLSHICSTQLRLHLWFFYTKCKYIFFTSHLTVTMEHIELVNPCLRGHFKVHVVTNNYALSTFLSFLACLEDEKRLVCMYTGCCLITPKSKSSKNRANRHDVWHNQICCTLLSLSHRCVVVFVTYQRWHHSDCELPCGNPLTPHNCLTAFASIKICACVSLICLRGAAICWGGGHSNGNCLSSESLTGWSAGLNTDNCLKEKKI